MVREKLNAIASRFVYPRVVDCNSLVEINVVGCLQEKIVAELCRCALNPMRPSVGRGPVMGGVAVVQDERRWPRWDGMDRTKEYR